MVETAETTETGAAERFDQWAILELMGHVRLAGRVTEEELFGTKMGRIDVPGPNGTFTTQYFGGSSVYRITPTTEELARAVAIRSQPEPVHRWELPKPAEPERAVTPYAQGSVDGSGYCYDCGRALPPGRDEDLCRQCMAAQDDPDHEPDNGEEYAGELAG